MSSKCVNKVILIGYLGKDPETKYTSNGNIISILNLATSDSWKDKKTNEIISKTEWHKIILFGKIAEISSNLLKKGYQIYIEGNLKTRKWKDNNNIERYITEIIVSINGVMKILNYKNNNYDINLDNNNYNINLDNKENNNINFDIKNDFDENDIPF